MDRGIVPGRECGTCAVCCIVPRIQDAVLQKMPGVRCTNLQGDNRCAIYEARPQTCRSFLCGWRLFPDLGDEWRPDRSGVLLMPDFDAMPGYRGTIVRMQVAKPDLLFAAPVLNVVCGMIAARTAVYLTLGNQPLKTFLNPALEDAVAAQDVRAITGILAGIVRDQANFSAGGKVVGDVGIEPTTS